ncbi:hypothetical protein FEM33_05570 [Dyadobacter flavalbus]|uniref:Uncharacterized protein n=1 Tax=Dyadobacter flavalbus TaxID=2579942 RepID=A0A5M8QZD1_9BACT|nr:hypothetical protein [Dyadobacter flavalbus]KAA6440074.1 hypothetical protein FEM33_05570 [Dyadobacter flavalbus]
MSSVELKSEVIRLVNEMDAAWMEDLLSSIRVFIEQQHSHHIDTTSPELLKSLNESLIQAGQNNLFSNEEVLKKNFD